MYQLIKEGEASNTPIQQFYCDASTDLVDIPSNAPIFSEAYIINENKQYIKDSTGQWVEKQGTVDKVVENTKYQDLNSLDVGIGGADNGEETNFSIPTVAFDFNNGSRQGDQDKNFVYSVLKPTNDAETYVNYTDEIGAIHLYNSSGYANPKVAECSFYSGENSQSQEHKHMSPYFNLDNGFTIDMRMKIEGLPYHVGEPELIDPSAYPFGQYGLVMRFNIFGGTLSRGLFFSMFDTSAGTMITCCEGQCQNISSSAESWNYEGHYFTPVKGKYARYTFQYEASTNNVHFYVNGILQATFTLLNTNIGRPTVVNAINLILQHNIFCAYDDLSSNPVPSIYIDKIYMYDNNYEPITTNIGIFERDGAEYAKLKYYYSIAYAIIEYGVDYIYTDKSHTELDTAFTYADDLFAATNLPPIQKVQRGTELLYNALQNLDFKPEYKDKILQIAHDYNNEENTWGFDWNDKGYGFGYPYAWTNDCILFSKGYDCTQYRTSIGIIGIHWASIVLVEDSDGYYRIEELNDYDYSDARTTTVPDNGFILYLHIPDVNLPSDPNAYMSKDFGANNSVSLSNFSVGDRVMLIRPFTNMFSRTEIPTIGTWYTKVDPQLNRSNITIPTYKDANTGIIGPMKDYFKDFKTFVYLLKV